MEVNRTLFRKLVSGPEDPKLVASPAASVHGPYGVAFSSYPPSWTRPGCAQTDAAVQQMFMAASGTSLQDQTPTPGVRLQCGETELDEKNWIAFNYKDQQHFVYSVQPHVVVAARVLDGACSQRWQSNFKPFNDAFAAGLKLHGSATAVPFKGAYLALMHTVDAQNTYTTFAYTFEAEPPFAPTAVSRPLVRSVAAAAHLVSPRPALPRPAPPRPAPPHPTPTPTPPSPCNSPRVRLRPASCTSPTPTRLSSLTACRTRSLGRWS